jgi:hypothetical protein
MKINDAFKPLLKRLVVAAVMLPPVVALTNYEPHKPVHVQPDTLKVYRVNGAPVADAKPQERVTKPSSSFLNDRCTGVESPGL